MQTIIWLFMNSHIVPKCRQLSDYSWAHTSHLQFSVSVTSPIALKCKQLSVVAVNSHIALICKQLSVLTVKSRIALICKQLSNIHEFTRRTYMQTVVCNIHYLTHGTYIHINPILPMHSHACRCSIQTICAPAHMLILRAINALAAHVNSYFHLGLVHVA